VINHEETKVSKATKHPSLLFVFFVIFVPSWFGVIAAP